MNAQVTKELLNGRAEEFARWLFPNGRKNGPEWLVGSLQGEAGRSLSIRISGDKTGLFRDFATGDGGDNLIELFCQARQVPFKEALDACTAWAGVRAPSSTRSAPAKPCAHNQGYLATDVYSLSGQECRRALGMAGALSSNESLCERIARARGWKAETIRQLGMEVHLGWSENKLAFIYDTGTKLRWRSNGERIIRWAFGKPWIWRGAWINAAKTVYVTEGEPDCISLLDGGIENDSGTIAVATPSASTFNSSWASLFDGKHVVLAFDNDKAGEDATARVSKLLQNHCRSLGKLNWKGLQYASAS